MKPYLSGEAIPVINPQSGCWQGPTGLVSVGAAAMTSNSISFHAFDVGPAAATYAAIGVQITTVGAGGTAVNYRCGVYYDNGTGGKPAGLVPGSDSGDLVVIGGAVGIKAATFGSPLTLQPGRYWIGCKYAHTAVATTAPQCFQISSIVVLPGAAAGATWNTLNRGWSATGQVIGAMPDPAPAGIALVAAGIASCGLRAA